MSKETILEEFEREYCNNHNRKIRWLRGVFIDQEDQIREIEKFLSQAIDQTREETIESIVKYIRENLTAGESWERGDIYININNVETLGSGSFNWDNEFWDELKNDLLNNLKQ